MATIEDNTALLLYRVGPVLCAAPCLTISAIIEPPTLTRPPGSDLGHPGIFKHANSVVSSLDLRYKFGVEEADWAKPGRTIVTQLEKGHVGFYVDEILDVISWPGSGWGPLPALLPRGIFSRTLLCNEQIFLYAEFKDLQRIPDSGYLRQYIQHLLQAKQQKTPAPPPATEHASTNGKTLAQQSPQTPEQAPPQHPDPTRPRPRPTPEIAASPRPISASSQRSLPKKLVKRPPVALPRKPTDSARVPPRQTTPSRKATTRITSATTIHPHQPNKPTSSGVVESITHTPTSPHRVVAANTISHKPAALISNNNTTGPTAPVAPNRKHEITRHTDYTHPLLVAFMLLLLFTVIGVGVWYLFPANTIQTSPRVEAPVTPNSARPHVPAAQVNTTTVSENHTAPTTQTAPAKPQAIPAKLMEPVPATGEPTPSTPTKNTLADIPSPATDSTPATDDQNAYHASIKQDAQGLTITLDAPADDPVFTQAPSPPSQTTTKPSVATTTTDKPLKKPNAQPAATNTTTTSNADEVTTTSPQTVEIIHIVVKGDTLWDIARRYVQNPFRYPELARLSKIKNPDLIYPGNRVRIIKRKHQP
jgi:chemotaxis signal transduction protein/nucleoid-associated protein YgaU